MTHRSPMPPDGTRPASFSVRTFFGHLAAVWNYYMGEKRIRVISALSLADSVEALQNLRGFDGLCIRSGKDDSVIVNSTRHYGLRGRPLIPFLRGRFQTSPEGVALSATLSIERCARAMIILFLLVLCMAWAAIFSSPEPGHVFAGVLTTGIFWGMLELGYRIGKQDIEQIVNRVTIALTAKENHGKRASPSSRSA